MKTFALSLCCGALLLAQSAPDALHDPLHYTQEGDKLFAAGKYEDAVVPYQKAFDLQKLNLKNKGGKPPRGLIVNLAKAYGEMGKLTAEEEILQYGIARDAADPMFYYLMAHVYAGRNDRENTMKYLRLALQHRQKPEDLPDPRHDEAFVRFYKHDDLRDVVNLF